MLFFGRVFRLTNRFVSSIALSRACLYHVRFEVRGSSGGVSLFRVRRAILLNFWEQPRAAKLMTATGRQLGINEIFESSSFAQNRRPAVHLRNLHASRICKIHVHSSAFFPAASGNCSPGKLKSARNLKDK